MEPEVEKFEITQDDLDNEFNPTRRTFRQTKNQATYGVWADSESDDDERPSFGGGGRKGKDFTAPIGFVSGGIKVGSKVTKDGAGEDDEDGDAIVNKDDVAALLGRPKRIQGGLRSSTNKGYGGKRQGFAGTKEGMGDWEQHTKGIGAKLLEKMGHVPGKGLGKNLQGISTPVEAAKRRGKGAIGFHGSERTERSLQDYPVQADSEEEEEEEYQKLKQQWKKPDKNEKKKKVKYNYKTADELIASGSISKRKYQQGVQSELSKVKVIDMTGREQRVLSGYHALGHKHDRPDEEDTYSQPEGKKQFDMPELLHNLDLLVEMTEDEILHSNKKLTYEQDLVVNLRHERDKLNEVCDKERSQIDKLKEVMEIVDSCEKRTRPDSTDPMSLEECADILRKLQAEYYELYKIFGLSDLAVGMVQPLMQKEFAGWEPLKRPRQGIVTIRNWKTVLSDGINLPYQQGSMDPYQKLIWDVWMPHIRNTTMKSWQVRDCDPLVELLEAWKPLLPHWILINVLDQLVMPRLQQEVDNWNPLTDTVPIHAWIHPWLPLLGDKLEPLFAPIRHKLANALQNWHPSDPSAKMMLEPWNGVFRTGHMAAFIVKNIVPKLALALQELVINPHQQHLDAWNWVMLWRDIVPEASMISLLEQTFFPKWLQVLCTWLGSSPNYEEVTEWYRGWKSMFDEKLLSHPSIKDKFNKALEIMNRAVTGQPYQPGVRGNIGYLTSTERRQLDINPIPPPPPPPQPGMASISGPIMPTSFKELIERKAEENNLIYLPIPNKFQEAKQVYKFGRVHIYLDRGVTFVFEAGKGWIPVSLNNLVEKAKG